MCEEFWKFVRGILAKATPIGFMELPDPESVIPKGKKDANTFLHGGASLQNKDGPGEYEVDARVQIKVAFHLIQDVLYILADNYACTPSCASMAENALFAAVLATSTGSGFCNSVGCGKDELYPV
eukprot:8500373-Ditylum_brightwellii.AAC.1